MKVRFKLAWRHYRVGDIIEPPGTLRQWLQSRGYVDVLEPTPCVEVAMVERVTEQATTRRKRR